VPLEIRLLGTPSITVDGISARPPRGRKSWAVLAYVLLAERPPSRASLASLLFADADDPRGALRWSLAEIRRGLRPAAEIVGDPIRIRFDTLEPIMIDVENPADGGELLEGMTFGGCDAFETWLLVQRRRLGGLIEAALRQSALSRLAVGQAAPAAALAAQLVGRDPLDQGFQELLVRCLAAAGQPEAALTQVTNYELLVRRELGVDPAPSVRRALNTSATTQRPGTGGVAAASVRARLQAGHAAISAGAVDVGLDHLRQAAQDAAAAKDRQLHLSALIELGGALVHSVRGRNEEGTVVLHEALAAARDSGDSQACVKVCRELGFLDVQAGRRQSANLWLDEAERLAEGDDGELAAVLGVHGMNLSDCARYPQALTMLEASLEHSRRAKSRRQQAWTMSLIGRLHLLCGRTSQARAVLDECVSVVQDERWTAFLPWPQTLHADVELTEKRFDAARDGYSHAYALACQLGDPCWEGAAAKGLAQLEARTGNLAEAMTWLEDGRSRCNRWPDTYQWVHAALLDAGCDIALAAGAPAAAGQVEALALLAGRTGMREFVVRSHLYRARLGQAGAIEAARLGAAEIENPQLAMLFDGSS
jgi:DNA-binding SARP family transcriptional activator